MGLKKILGNPVILQSIVFALDDENAKVRFAAAKSITDEIYDLRENNKDDFQVEHYKIAIDPLIRNLKHEDFKIREIVVYALGLIQDQRSLPDLLPLLNDQNEDVQLAVLYALARIPNEEAFPFLEHQYNQEYGNKIKAKIIDTINKSLHPAAFAFLANLAENETEMDLRKKAIVAIGSKNNDQAIEILYQIIEEGNLDFLGITLNSLESFSDTRILDSLLKLLEHNIKESLLMDIVNVLGKFKQKKAVDTLIQVLGKEEYLLYSEDIILTIKEILGEETIEHYLQEMSITNNEAFNLGVKRIKEDAQLSNQLPDPDPFAGYKRIL